ncbi:MAG: aminomethyl-transferring glycine dehydrogenase subunit GcvPB [Thermoplasmataceae archaeon]
MMTYHQATYDEKLLNEIKSENNFKFQEQDETIIPEKLRRKHLNLPDIAEYDVIRHYTRLSQMNYCVDLGIYPLGSCTMKFNPKFADQIASMKSFSETHPLQHESTIQGNLQIMYELQESLKEISGMERVSLQPLAGAHGEYTSLLIIKKYLEVNNQATRDEIIIPDSAHGTNPASASMAGFSVVQIPSNPDGGIDIEALKAAIGPKTAAFMITNPNTLGVFEPKIREIASIVHSAGALLYYDGANFNAIVGITNPGKMGFDLVHFNLHKTFATPHGGGGPGAGPIAVNRKLMDYIPEPFVDKNENGYFFNHDIPKTIGKVSAYQGSFMNLLRAWSYIRYHGKDGMYQNTVRAVMNANYVAKKLQGKYDSVSESVKKHEVVVSSQNTGKRAMDIAKYLINNGVHSPTIYFPLIVHEALMIEPTEDVSIEDLDNFCNLMTEALEKDNAYLQALPNMLPIGRADEVKAAKDLKLRW